MSVVTKGDTQCRACHLHRCFPEEEPCKSEQWLYRTQPHTWPQFVDMSYPVFLATSSGPCAGLRHIQEARDSAGHTDTFVVVLSRTVQILSDRWRWTG
jgi:hypothetical protein